MFCCLYLEVDDNVDEEEAFESIMNKINPTVAVNVFRCELYDLDE